MQLANFSVASTLWSSLAASTAPGETGSVTWRAQQAGDIQLRLVDYSAGYLADHWCHKGHIVFVVSGELVIEHQDGAAHRLMPGMSYQVADNDGAPHRVRTAAGAQVFIVD